MTKKIEKLTAEQEARMLEFRNEWLNIGLSTDRAIRPVAENALGEMYKLIGKKRPVFWWIDSPMMANLVINFIKIALRNNLGNNLGNNLRDNLERNLRNNLRDNLWNNLRNNLRDNLERNLRNNLRDNLESNLWNNLRNNLWNNLGNNLRNNLWSNLGDNLWSNLGDNLRNNLRNNLESNLWSNLGDNLESNLWSNLWSNLGDNLWSNLGDNLESNLRNNLESNLERNLGNNLERNLGDNLEYQYTYFWGSLDSYWIAFYFFPHLHLRPMHSEFEVKTLNLWADIAKSAFWWYPFENICFVCERPASIQKDDQTRLHNESGPSVAFSDDWKLYHWHGVEVPPYVIERPQEITVQKIDNESNAEIRRVMLERFGQERFLLESGTKPVHSDEFGTLYFRPLADDEPLVMVKVKNSTPEPDGSFKDYFLRVPPTAKTAREAVAWTFGMNEKEYQPQIET